jgi:hypothetical protein
MIVQTAKQLDGAKRRASVAPEAKTKKSMAKTTGISTRAATASKASKAPEPIAEKKNAAKKKPGNEMLQAEANERGGVELLPDSTAKKVRTMAQNAVDVAAPGCGDDCTDTPGGAKCTYCGIPVKALTEAGKKRLVNKLLGLADTQATQGGFKITPADLIRLMQLHREMNPQKDRKVTVQWIEDRPE